jgi:hypothetical protein
MCSPTVATTYVAQLTPLVAKTHRRFDLNCHALLAGLGLIAFFLVLAPALAATAPTLGTAQSFAVLGATTVTNTGATVITGDLGVSPGSAVTGFPPGVVTGGEIHVADTIALEAQNAVLTAYNNLAGQSFTADLTGQDLGGRTLTAGVYRFSSSAQLTGTLTLDAAGDPNAVFIFQVGSTLTTASNSAVSVINGGQYCNVFWQIGTSATLGTGTTLVGNILAFTSITLTTGASVNGRVLARNGAVTLDTNNASVSICRAATTLSTQASATVPVGGTVFDTATLSGGVSPTGTITYRLFGPNNANCTGAAKFTTTVSVVGNGSYRSARFAPLAVGMYRWIASYSGDSNNAASTGACNDANESVIVSASAIIAPIVAIPTLSGWARVRSKLMR